MSSLEDFYEGAKPYVALFDAFAKKHKLLGAALPDHLCYKCGSSETFERLRTLFENESEYLHQSIISKRRIAYIKLKKPIPTSLGNISFVELSDRKPEGVQTDHYDHIEAYSVLGTYKDFVHTFEATEKVVEDVRPHHTTHDIDIGSGFLFRCTQEPLIDKIKREEMR